MGRKKHNGFCGVCVGHEQGSQCVYHLGGRVRQVFNCPERHGQEEERRRSEVHLACEPSTQEASRQDSQDDRVSGAVR